MFCQVGKLTFLISMLIINNLTHVIVQYEDCCITIKERKAIGTYPKIYFGNRGETVVFFSFSVVLEKS